MKTDKSKKDDKPKKDAKDERAASKDKRIAGAENKGDSGAGKGWHRTK